MRFKYRRGHTHLYLHTHTQKTEMSHPETCLSDSKSEPKTPNFDCWNDRCSRCSGTNFVKQKERILKTFFTTCKDKMASHGT